MRCIDVALRDEDVFEFRRTRTLLSPFVSHSEDRRQSFLAEKRDIVIIFNGDLEPEKRLKVTQRGDVKVLL